MIPIQRAGGEALPIATERRVVPAILVVGALLVVQQVLLWWLYYHGQDKQLVGDEVHYLAGARSILAGGPWDQSALWPPAQALFIAAILLLGKSVLAVQIVQMLLFLGCGLLLWHLWSRLSGNATAGALAAALFLVNPSDAAYAQYLWPEIPHLFCLLLALDLLLARRPSRIAALGAGLSIGLALLFKSLLTGFWPVLLLCFVTWRPLKVRWSGAGLFVLGVAITIAPAVIAGHRDTGRWSIADSSAINLLIGLDDSARNDYIPGPSATLFAAYEASGSDAQQRDRWAWQQIRERLRNTPPLTLIGAQLDRQYFRLFESKTLLLTQLPGPRCAGYLGSYSPRPSWLVGIVRWSSHLGHALMLVGFAFGLCLRRNWREPWLWILFALLGYQLALYLGLHVQARYLLPMTPIFCGFAGDAVARLGPETSRVAVHRGALFVGAALAALLLWLAFAAPWIDGYCRI